MKEVLKAVSRELDFGLSFFISTFCVRLLPGMERPLVPETGSEWGKLFISLLLVLLQGGCIFGFYPIKVDAVDYSNNDSTQRPKDMVFFRTVC